MAQPTFNDLFGTGTNFDGLAGALMIPATAIEAAGITDASAATPLEILAAIAKTSHEWLVDNTDETVQATSRLDFSAPFFRNNVDRSSFIYNLQFLTDFDQPIFNPNQV